MARTRCDDVEYRIVEAPAPARPRRGRRWAIGGAAAVFVAAGLAAGAATSGSAARKGAPPVPRAWHDVAHMHYGAAGIPPPGVGTSPEPARRGAS
ncbi:MAG TPA: hypothetical protein VH418_09195 [Solirubrobacteraceae bacterium]|jgi:hypothetical protein